MTTTNGVSADGSPVTVSLKDLENGSFLPHQLPGLQEVSLTTLSAGSVPLSSLEGAFGPDSLGIIVVKDLSSKYIDLRKRVLSYSSYLANLPQDELGMPS